MSDETEQPVAFCGRNVGAGMIDKPAKALHEGFRADLFEISECLLPLDAAARRSQNIGRLPFAAAKLGAVDTIDHRLFAVGHHEFVPVPIDGAKAEELPSAGVNRV